MSPSDRAFSSRVITPRDPLGLLEGRWILQILLRLKDGHLRFSDLRAALPAISANVLAQRMRDLEAAGLVRRLYLPPPAASQVYALAPSADSLRPALEYLAHWRARHRAPAHQEPV